MSTQALPLQLRDLKLSGFAHHHEALAEQAQQEHLSYAQYRELTAS